MRLLPLCLIVLGLIVLVLGSVLAVAPIPALEFPRNYAKNLVRYAVSDRPDGVVRKLYVSKAALEAVRKGQNLPLGTLLVIEEFEARRSGGKLARDVNGRLMPGQLRPRLDVRRKVKDLPRDVDNWQNERFDAFKGNRLETNLADCWICHQSAEKADFVFSLPALKAFVSSGTLERHDCNLPERQLCAHDFDF